MLFNIKIEGHAVPDYIIELRGHDKALVELQAWQLFRRKHAEVPVTKVTTTRIKEC